MALSYKARKRWSLVILLVALPAYIVATITVIDILREEYGQPALIIELLVFVVLGVIWALPLKKVFLGIGQADPDAANDDKP